MDPGFLPPCVTQLNVSSMVRAQHYSACRLRHAGSLELYLLAFKIRFPGLEHRSTMYKRPENKCANWKTYETAFNFLIGKADAHFFSCDSYTDFPERFGLSYWSLSAAKILGLSSPEGVELGSEPEGVDP